MAVPSRLNAPVPSHEATLRPRSASSGPTWMSPMRTCESRVRMGLWITPPAIAWAWFTINPANDTPGTTNRNSAVTTTAAAASAGRTRFASHLWSGANTT